MASIYNSVSARRTPQDQPATTSQVKNNAGGYTFTIDPLAQAKRFLILGTDAGTYYQDAPTLTRDTAAVIIALAEQRGTELVDLIVDVSTAGKAPKQQPTLFALAIAASIGSDESKAYALSKLGAVARTGTHLFLFATYVEQFRGWGRGLRKAVGNWYLDKPVDQVAYQAVKYRQRDGWSHRDVLRLTHPKTLEPARRALFDWIANRPASDGIPPIVEGFLKAQEPTADIPFLISEYGLSWEMLPDDALTQLATWDALIDNGLPMTALLRQLPRLTRLGVIGGPFAAGARTSEVVAQLTDADRLRKARVHPISILTALKTYSSGRGRGSEWAPVTQIIDALDDAFYKAFPAVQAAGKRTLIGLDVSGSMGQQTDAQGILTAREVGAALSLVTMSTEPASDVYGFTAAGGGNRWSSFGYSHKAAFTHLNISPRQRLNDVIRATSNLPFGGTDCALPMLEATKQNWTIDTFVTITDNETWAGSIHPHQALEQYRQHSGIDAKMIVLAVTPTKFTIANPADPAGQLDIAGFGTDVPQLVTEFSRGL
jgi:60 kDa SS-A/Ro ribonucleoprotein